MGERERGGRGGDRQTDRHRQIHTETDRDSLTMDCIKILGRGLVSSEIPVLVYLIKLTNHAMRTSERASARERERERERERVRDRQREKETETEERRGVERERG